MTKEERRLRALRDVLPGQVLPGSDGSLYPLRERVGEGSQGWVFRATWNGSVDVVVKVLRPEAATRDTLARFQREAQVLRMLSQQPRPNPHVVRFFDHAYATVHVPETGDTWTLPFTVIEYVDGLTLETVLSRANPAGLGVDRARRILRHTSLALRDVHAQNVVHRDLKPSNILIDTSAGREVAKVTDFGLAKLIDGSGQKTTFAGASVGYAPPEQFEHGNKRVGRHTDIFSLATIFYEIVTGAAAFPFHESDNPAFVVRRVLEVARPAFARIYDRLPPELQARPDVVAALDGELARALSPEPEERHATVVDLYESIDKALAALGGATSLPRAGQHGLVGPSTAPPSIRDANAITEAPTMLADPSSQDAPPVIRVSSADVVGDAANAANANNMAWRVLTPAIGLGVFTSIAVSADGLWAVGAGGGGVGRWDGRAWTSLDLPQVIEPHQIRLVSVSEQGDVLLAGASSLIATISPAGAYSTTRFEGEHFVFYDGYVDTNGGMTLVGERKIEGRSCGVIAQVAPRPGGTLAPRVIRVPDCGPLRGVVRLDADLVACGDAGTLVLLRSSGSPKRVTVCEAPLYALLPLGDGTAAAVGAGGFVFRVWPSLEAQLESIQTTRDLYALARAPNGTMWTGGAACRVLVRDRGGWTRVGAPGADTAAVRALHATDTHVLAFCDDGSVVEGTRS
ncbi:MAG: serine/threonine-protein kinase [Polyangiaceae bacterium]